MIYLHKEIEKFCLKKILNFATQSISFYFQEKKGIKKIQNCFRESPRALFLGYHGLYCPTTFLETFVGNTTSHAESG